jgi:hypothetical protein
MKTTSERIKELREEIKAMQIDPLLREGYKEKVQELIRLRRQKIREGKNG